jgi:hypothetical protein
MNIKISCNQLRINRRVLELINNLKQHKTRQLPKFKVLRRKRQARLKDKSRFSQLYKKRIVASIMIDFSKKLR